MYLLQIRATDDEWVTMGVAHGTDTAIAWRKMAELYRRVTGLSGLAFVSAFVSNTNVRETDAMTVSLDALMEQW